MRKFLRLSAAVMLSLIAFTVNSQTFVVDGITYKVISTTDNTVEVASNNYSYTGDIVIPATVTNAGVEYKVTKIGNSAFYYCYTVTAISLPEGITEIGESAFEYCARVTTLTIPESVTTISNGAFGYCNSLTSLVIPKNVTSIATYITYGSKSLTEIVVAEENPNYTSVDGALYSKDKSKLYAYPNKRYTDVVIPDGVTTIMDGTFWECTNIKSISIPESVTTLKPFCFYSCEGLTTINLPQNITSVPQGAFYYCEALESVVVPDKVTDIGQTAFADCGALKSVKLGTGVTAIGVSAFMNSENLSDIELPAGLKSLGMSSLRGTAIETITIPKKCTSIGDYAFMGCDKLKEIHVEKGNTKFSSKDGVLCDYQGWKILAWPGGKSAEYSVPAGITNIGDDSFSYCETLEKVELCNDVTTIGSYAFSDDINLKTVVLGEKVSSIKEGAFAYCTSLNEIHCKNATPVSITTDVFKKVTTGNCTLYVPVGAKSAYASAAVWKSFNIVEESSSVEDNMANAVNVRAVGGNILVECAENANVEVYTVGGELKYQGVNTVIGVSEPGIYLVRVGKVVKKIVVRF